MRRAPVVTHPLRAAEVLRRAGITLPTGHTAEDDLLRSTCGVCGLDQSLAQAKLEPALRVEDVSAYLCLRCDALLLVTGHPQPFGVAEPYRHVIGELAIQPCTPSGMRLALPAR